jgi:hypothetical protein
MPQSGTTASAKVGTNQIQQAKIHKSASGVKSTRSQSDYCMWKKPSRAKIGTGFVQ